MSWVKLGPKRFTRMIFDDICVAINNLNVCFFFELVVVVVVYSFVSPYLPYTFISGLASRVL